MNRPPRRSLLMIAIWGTILPEVAHAYVDPGSVGFIVTTILGSLAAAGYVAREYLRRFKRRIFRGDQRARKGGASDVKTEAEGDDDTQPQR